MACKSCKKRRTYRRRSKVGFIKGNTMELAKGGGLALLAEYLVADKVVTNKTTALIQTGLGVAGYLMSGSDMVKGAALVLAGHGAYKAFAGKNLVTQAAIQGVSPYYRLNGIRGVDTVQRATNDIEANLV